MTNLNRPLCAKRVLSVLSYTTNQQPDGTSAPYVALPADYFPKPDQLRRIEQAEYWIPKMHQCLNACGAVVPSKEVH